MGVEGAGEGLADTVEVGLRVIIKFLGGAVDSDSEGVGFAVVFIFLPFGIGLRACSEEASTDDGGY